MSDEQERDRSECTCPEAGTCTGSDRTTADRPTDAGRRKLLAAMASGGTLALAGCIDVFATPATKEPPILGIEDSFSIEFLNEEETIDIRGNQTLLETAEEHGLNLPYFCRTGFCGVCLSKVDGDTNEMLEMSINQFDPLDEAAMEEGYTLTCTAYPRADFSIETGLAGALEEVDDDDDDEDDPDDDVTGVTHTVDFVNEQWTIEVPEDQSLLTAGEDRGFDLPYRCRAGWCGECLAQVDGDTRDLVHLEVNDYEYLDDAALAEGYTLTCQGFARDDFSLETGKFEEEDWPGGSPP